MTLCRTITGKFDCRKETATYQRWCYISALLFTCFRLKKGRATFFRPVTIVVSFLHLMVLFFKVLLNYSFISRFIASLRDIQDTDPNGLITL